MSVTTDVVDGRPVVLIDGADGKRKTYQFSVECRPGWWCCTLRQGGGLAYAVVCRGDGEWSCTCPDWKYRTDRHERPCKHCVAGQGLKQLLETMAGSVES
jgi:hypothetical protein